MRIVITGASGFIGSRLVAAARALYGDDEVVALGRDLHRVEAAILEGAEVLIHAGAFTPKNAGQADDVVGNTGNITLTQALLDLPFGSLTRVIYLSTLDVYLPADRISETTPTGPASLYGLSKLYTERMMVLFARQRNIRCTVLRIGHVYGPGEEKYAKFLPRAIASIVRGDSVELWGEGTELRSFLYIDDVVKAILAAVTLEDVPSVVNVVGGHPISIRSLLDLLVELSGRAVTVVHKAANGPTRDFVFDTTLLKSTLLPRESDLADGLAAEIAHIESIG